MRTDAHGESAFTGATICPTTSCNSTSILAWSWLLLPMLLAGLLVTRVHAQRSPLQAGAKSLDQVSTSRVPYEVVKRWKIPAGGEGKLIAIDPALSTEKNLERLIRQLRDETRDDRFASVQVFTSRDAAHMRDRANTLTEDQSAFFDKAYVAYYFKNEGQGVLDMEIMPEGINGPVKVLKP